ncbi:hypothetical protein ACFY7C_19415 [Streptomyces sp. NPDC012769]|uniref:hypothetical protein n=1 Tax=Streptomyces sp. NPDC012769 TaxID=3364848 RepID=UPI003698932A
MSAREDLRLLAAQDMPVTYAEVDAAIDAYAHELAEMIRTDMERQRAGGQYDMGMKRAIFLIEP